MKTNRFQIVLLALLLAVGGLVFLDRQAIIDWSKLRNYTPPASVATLAVDDTMTDQARHLFYVNHPSLTSGKALTQFCPVGGEKTVVLGCYVGNDNGIYMYDVTDMRLDGVEQVTAAHEMLHAAYRRLSNGERKHVDAMLTDYYEHDLTDQRIKDTIAAYKKSEPNDVVNEMHSVFGTEVAQLPAPLEAYYAQYFTSRSKVTDYTARYQQEFTSRRAQIANYDAKLQTLKQQIDTNLAQLGRQKATLESQNTQLQQERNNGQVDVYNIGVASYNQTVNVYNALATETKKMISQYNDIVTVRNQIVLEEQQLVQALSADSVPQ